MSLAIHGHHMKLQATDFIGTTPLHVTHYQICCEHAGVTGDGTKWEVTAVSMQCMGGSYIVHQTQNY